MPVDRIALYEKLEKMGISLKSVYRENHATVAVEEFVALTAEDAVQIKADDCSFDSPDVEETIWHKCPKCTHEWKTEETFYPDSTEVDGDEIAGAVEVVLAAKGPALSPGSLVLTAEEVAYMVLDFARTQGGER
jgi:hypothetical protein